MCNLILVSPSQSQAWETYQVMVKVQVPVEKVVYIEKPVEKVCLPFRSNCLLHRSSNSISSTFFNANPCNEWRLCFWFALRFIAPTPPIRVDPAVIPTPRGHRPPPEEWVWSIALCVLEGQWPIGAWPLDMRVKGNRAQWGRRWRWGGVGVCGGGGGGLVTFTTLCCKGVLRICCKGALRIRVWVWFVMHCQLCPHCRLTLERDRSPITFWREASLSPWR